MTAKTALTIAGSDPSGGAGIQADLKTFHQHGVFGMSVLTLLTVQNTQTLKAVEILDPKLVGAQLLSVLNDIPPTAVKTGALGNKEVIEEVARHLSKLACPLVVDPVMISKHGKPLLSSNAADALKELVFPHAFLITPNIPEAETLVNRKIKNEDSMLEACEALATLGPKHVLLKGGHLEDSALDILWSNGKAHYFPAERIDTKNTHGTGCVTSAAITANLANGKPITEAVSAAKAFITEAIRTNPELGQGQGPVNLFVETS